MTGSRDANTTLVGKTLSNLCICGSAIGALFRACLLVAAAGTLHGYYAVGSGMCHGGGRANVAGSSVTNMQTDSYGCVWAG
jgi:hypothetical protein